MAVEFMEIFPKINFEINLLIKSKWSNSRLVNYNISNPNQYVKGLNADNDHRSDHKHLHTQWGSMYD